MQWNCRGINARMIELKKYLTSCRYIPDVICLQESLLKSHHNFVVQNYDTVRKDRDGDGGGIAILIKHGINYRTIDSPLDIECNSIEIFGPTNKIQIRNIYIPPKGDINIDSFK